MKVKKVTVISVPKMRSLSMLHSFLVFTERQNSYFQGDAVQTKILLFTCVCARIIYIVYYDLLYREDFKEV